MSKKVVYYKCGFSVLCESTPSSNAAAATQNRPRSDFNGFVEMEKYLNFNNDAAAAAHYLWKQYFFNNIYIYVGCVCMCTYFICDDDDLILFTPKRREKLLANNLRYEARAMNLRESL